MHSPTFPGTFSSNYLMYICVDKLQNIYYNMKDSEHFGECNFPFLCLRQPRVLFVHLLLFAETLLCKLGFWGPKQAPEAVTLLTVKYAFSHCSWYLFFKNLTYNYVGTYTKYLFQYKASGYFDKFVLQNWFSLHMHQSVNQESGAYLGPQKLLLFFYNSE